MNAETRRKQITNLLSDATAPISASKLAQELGVSRQVIVQDVAVLRASGIPIESLARGYVLKKTGHCQRVFKVYHSDEEVEAELNTVVDAGGVVVDVFVFHKVYGMVRAAMGIRSRLQVREFLQNIACGKSSLLKNVTAGYHYHTVAADSEQTLDLIEEQLLEKGFLAPRQAYEPLGVIFAKTKE